MDLAKALGVLGFTSTRWLDMSSGLSPKQELDKAHFAKMMEIMKKKKVVNHFLCRLATLALLNTFIFSGGESREKEGKRHRKGKEWRN